MKKLLLTVLVLSSFVGCVTPMIKESGFPRGIEYEVLGRVTISNAGFQNGYLKLIKQAKKDFPNSDDVVNVYVDRGTSIFNYRLTGIVIKYKN